MSGGESDVCRRHVGGLSEAKRMFIGRYRTARDVSVWCREDADVPLHRRKR